MELDHSQSVSIYDIAKEAKVSPVTVSRVYSGKAPVAEKTKQRVLEVAARYHYAPSAIAQALNGQKTKSIGMLWPMGGPHAPATMVHEVALGMLKHGYVIHPHENLSDPDITKKILADLVRRRVDAVIFNSYRGWENDSQLRPLLERFDAVVAVNPYPCEGDPPADCVHYDRQIAIGQVVDYLVDTNRRRPIMIIGSKRSFAGKIKAFQDHFAALGFEVPAERIIPVDFHDLPAAIDYLPTKLDKCFGNKIPFDAVMCGNDEMAAAAALWLGRRGVKVGEDVAVIGFNNSAFTACIDPPLASVERCTGAMARLIENLLLSRLDNPKRPWQREYMPMEFKWRQSAGPKPGNNNNQPRQFVGIESGKYESQKTQKR